MHERPLQHQNHPSHNLTIDKVDPDETKLSEVAKHPFGIVTLYIATTLGVLTVIFLSFFLIPSLFEEPSQALAVAGIVSVVLMLFSVLILLLATYVYRQNRLIITDRNITQILQLSLFARKTSQLNMVNVEDVTAEQNGIFATLFGFGVLTIETAGEQANFKFTYCPHPGYYAKTILNAREKILGQHDGDHRIDQTEIKNTIR